jgi:hypothetical protein
MKCFKYSNRQKSYITVVLLDDPYGENTEKVVSIGCTLKGDMQNPTWKVHVPLHLAESVGQELIRLSRPDTTKNRFASPQPRSSPAKETEVAAPSPADITALSERAVELGRVIKRDGGERAKKKA